MTKEIEKKDLPLIAALLKENVKADSYKNIERMGGLTNHTYKITLNNGENLVVRIPGEGTEEMIVRSDEKKSTMLAVELGVDARLLYFGDDGSKITEYIKDAVTMNAEELRKEERIAQVADIFKKMHSCGRSTGVAFEVFDMAAGYEKLINDYKVSMFEDYEDIKSQVMEIKKEIDASCDTTRVPCHNDSLCENWVFGNGRMYLIDWEYAGMNDAMWDLADVSIEAVYGHKEDESLLTRYFDKQPDALQWKHFLANKLYVDFLWTLWAKMRVPFDGQPMEDWACERYARLKDNLTEYKNI